MRIEGRELSRPCAEGRAHGWGTQLLPRLKGETWGTRILSGVCRIPLMPQKARHEWGTQCVEQLKERSVWRWDSRSI